jgi:Tfp pilus assembly protein PilO
VDKLKQWVALTLLGVFAVVAGGWFLLVSPKRGEASDLRAKVTSQNDANSQLQLKLAQLKALRKDLPAQQATLAAVSAKIPDNPALPALIRALDSAASTAGVELVSIAPAKPVPFVGGTGSQAAATSGLPNSTTAPAGTSTGLTTRAPVAIPLQQIGLIINVVGGYFQVEQFLDGLESLTRALKVTGFTLAPGENPVKPAAAFSGSVNAGKSLTAAITGQVYMVSLPAAAPQALVPATTK